MTMTGNTETSVVYEPDGMQTRFPVPFPVFHADDVYAIAVDGKRQTAMTNYAVEGIGSEEGVHVRFFTPPDFGPKLVLYRWTKRVQESDYPEGGRFPAKVVETDFDRLVAMAQEIDDQFEWTLKIPRGADVTPEEYTESLLRSSEDARAAADEAFSSARESVSAARDAREMALDAATQANNAALMAESAAQSALDAATTASQGVPDGSEHQKGAVRLATRAEHEAGAAGLAATPEHVKSMLEEVARMTGIPGIITPFSGEMGGPGNKHPVNRRTREADLSYALCDGGTYTDPDGAEVVTPDLRDRFIVGAGGAYGKGDTGGSDFVSVEGTTLTVAQMPSHTHYVGTNGWFQSGPLNEPRLPGPHGTYTSTAAGGSQAHTHTGAAGSNIPPYYALAFIMKL